MSPGPVPFTSLDLSFLFCPVNYGFHDPVKFLTPHLKVFLPTYFSKYEKQNFFLNIAITAKKG